MIRYFCKTDADKEQFLLEAYKLVANSRVDCKQLILTKSWKIEISCNETQEELIRESLKGFNEY